MAEFPLPVLQIWRSRKRVAIQIQLMNIHMSECKYYCLHSVPKFGDMCDRQNWRLQYWHFKWVTFAQRTVCMTVQTRTVTGLHSLAGNGRAPTTSRCEVTRSYPTRWQPKLGENGKRWISNFSLNNITVITQILRHIKDSLQNKIWNLPDRSTILRKFIYDKEGKLAKSCRTDPNFAGQCPRSGTYFEDCKDYN